MPESKPSGTEYPPPPWRLRGHLWAGIFRAAEPVPLPGELCPLIGPRRLLILLVRYEVGTLRYDELAIGTPARRGLRVGLWMHGLWVSDPASVRGGRDIWGLPKRLATFSWDAHGVRVADEAGPVAAFSVCLPGPCPIPFLVPVPFWGGGPDGLRFTVAALAGRAGRGHLRIREGAVQLPGALSEQPMVSLAAVPFTFTVPAPKRGRRRG